MRLINCVTIVCVHFKERNSELEKEANKNRNGIENTFTLSILSDEIR